MASCPHLVGAAPLCACRLASGSVTHVGFFFLMLHLEGTTLPSTLAFCRDNCSGLPWICLGYGDFCFVPLELNVCPELESLTWRVWTALGDMQETQDCVR